MAIRIGKLEAEQRRRSMVLKSGSDGAYTKKLRAIVGVSRQEYEIKKELYGDLQI